MKNKVLLISSLMLLSLSTLGVSKFNSAKALLNDETHDVATGDVISVNDRTLVHNNESKVVSGQIIFPDGSSKKGKSFTISMPGVYQVVYTAFFGVEEVSETITYRCVRTSGDFFEISGGKGSAKYGEYSYNTASKQANGALLTLDSSTVFTYNQVIDFSSFGSTNPFFEFIIDPSVQGDSDIESFLVRLTDVDNASNYVDIRIKDSGPIDDDGRGCYILGGSNIQYKAGYEGTTLHVNSYGTNVNSSFRALPATNPVRPCALYFDYAAKMLLVNPIYGSDKKGMITDLDDRNIYQSILWDGFANGKAILSIIPQVLLSQTAKMVITKMGYTDLSKGRFEDNSAPSIDIDYDGQNPSSLPNATINRPYKLFNASVKDNYDLNLSYSTSVTYQDSVNGKVKDISIINNEFTPKEAGKYTITYTARDYSNNVSTKKLTVNAVSESQAISISIDQDVMSDVIYSTFHLPSVNDVTVNGGSGVAKVERAIYDSSSNLIEIKGDDFSPSEVGAYSVFYTATDYIGNSASKKLTINALATTKPIFVGELILPRLLVKGHTYTLPNYRSVETIDGKTVDLPCEIYVNDELLSDNTFVASSTCNIKYKATGQSGSGEYETSITVIDGKDSSDQTAYFYGDFNVIENENNINLSTSTDASMLFASPLPYDDMLLYFETVKDKTNYQTLKIKYTDSKDPNISLTIKYRFVGEKTYVSLLNSPNEALMAYEDRDGVNLYLHRIHNLSRMLYDIDDGPVMNLKVDDNGNPFNGFSNGVYLEIFLEGVTSESSINIVTIANQDFGHHGYYVDSASPIILFKTPFKNEQNYGDDAELSRVEIFDVLGSAKGTINVKDPSGNAAIKNASTNEDITFKLDQFGSYIVTYSAKDNSGNISSFPRKISVYDNVYPELNVKNTLKETYKLNGTVEIPTYTVSDNLDKYTVTVFLILPNDEERVLLYDNNGEITYFLSKQNSLYNSSFKVNDTTFRLEQLGDYMLRFVASDEAFNKVVQDFHFTVK